MSSLGEFKSWLSHAALGAILFFSGIVLLLLSVSWDLEGTYGGSSFKGIISPVIMVLGILLLIVGGIIILYFKFKWRGYR